MAASAGSASTEQTIAQARRGMVNPPWPRCCQRGQLLLELGRVIRGARRVRENLEMLGDADYRAVFHYLPESQIIAAETERDERRIRVERAERIVEYG